MYVCTGPDDELESLPEDELLRGILAERHGRQDLAGSHYRIGVPVEAIERLVDGLYR